MNYKNNPYLYRWPTEELSGDQGWRDGPARLTRVRTLTETPDSLALDSRWPAIFPSPQCFVTTADDANWALEKVVGPSVVNRFPYIIALSFCRTNLSVRHHPRKDFTAMLERSGHAVVQFLPQGEPTDRAMASILLTSEAATTARIQQSGLGIRKALTNSAPVFCDAYLAYEVRLVRVGKDYYGDSIFPQAWSDCGSHRIYFLEVTAIQLQAEIASGRSQIHWQSLPEFSPRLPLQGAVGDNTPAVLDARYQKGFTPYYSFPSAGTVAFEADDQINGMQVKYLHPDAAGQIEYDDDRGRFPCFFPSSLGMITSWEAAGVPNLMPCGSTAVVSRHPFTIAVFACYLSINSRFTSRATLGAIRRQGWFGCGVAFANDLILGAIRYAGNISIATDTEKVAHAGLDVFAGANAPLLPALPVQFECRLVGEVKLGTHVMLLGEVKTIHVRRDLSPDHPIQWCPWAMVASGTK